MSACIRQSAPRLLQGSRALDGLHGRHPFLRGSYERRGVDHTKSATQAERRSISSSDVSQLRAMREPSLPDEDSRKLTPTPQTITLRLFHRGLTWRKRVCYPATEIIFSNP